MLAGSCVNLHSWKYIPQRLIVHYVAYKVREAFPESKIVDILTRILGASRQVSVSLLVKKN